MRRGWLRRNRLRPSVSSCTGWQRVFDFGVDFDFDLANFCGGVSERRPWGPSNAKIAGRFLPGAPNEIFRRPILTPVSGPLISGIGFSYGLPQRGARSEERRVGKECRS